MVTITTTYIVYTKGHRRHHANTQTKLIDDTVSTGSNGEVGYAYGWAQLPYMNADLPFAFMSVTGAADGNHLYTSSGTQQVQIGNQNIKILVVYAPVGGTGPGDGRPGVNVDAFIVDEGRFSDNDFMDVYTSGALDNDATSHANEDGWVVSTQMEDLRSFDSVEGIPFCEWKKIGGMDFSDKDYDLEKDETGFAFAFYQTGAVLRIPTIHLAYEGPYVLTPLGDGGNGYLSVHGPRPVGPGPEKEFIRIAPALYDKLSAKQKDKSKQLITEYTLMAKEITRALNKLNKVSEDLKGVVSNHKLELVEN